jgi:hypothetical protein
MRKRGGGGAPPTKISARPGSHKRPTTTGCHPRASGDPTHTMRKRLGPSWPGVDPATQPGAQLAGSPRQARG